MPVPAGIRCPMMMFSFNPSRSSLAPRIAASVNTLVVSWKEAAEINDCVVRLAFVMPRSSGSRVEGLPPFFTARSLISLNTSLSTFSPSRNSVSPGSTTFTFCSIWRTITPMCLSLIFTPCSRYTSCTSFSRYSCTARGPLIRRMSCGFTGPSVSRSPARTRSPSCTRKCFPAGTSYSCASPSSGCTQISRLPRLISPNRTTPSTSEIVAGSFGRRASNSSATRGRPPVISRVLYASRDTLASTWPAYTSWPSSIMSCAPSGITKSRSRFSLSPFFWTTSMCGWSFFSRSSMITRWRRPVISSSSSRTVSSSTMSTKRTNPPTSVMIGFVYGSHVNSTPSFAWDPYTNPIMTDVAGLVRFVDIVEDETVREELDEITGRRQRVIIEDREKKLHPHIEVVQKKGDKEKRLRDFVIPEGAQLMIEDGQEVYAGQVLAKVSREAYKTRDITGGLPRVAELFEARRPKDPATISEVDGVVRFGEIKRGKREIWVHPEEGEAQLYEVPAGKHLRVHEGDRVRAGDRLTEGPVNPHDILRIKGPRAVQEYLLNEVQEVYRLQGVKINDKHIGVIVRQMLQKVKVVEPGDTEFLEGENVDKLVFSEINERAVKKGGKPSTREPLLLGITKASLTTQSFISAASFQETTRVLTDAAIRGAKDDLLGLKENIIIGHLIPAGTGIYRYHDIEIEPPEGFQPPTPPLEAAVPGASPAPSPFPEEVEAE